MDSGTQMHFAKSRSGQALVADFQANGGHGRRSLGTLDVLEPDRESFYRRTLEERLRRDVEFRAKYERVNTEMLTQLAPATEGPIVNPGRRRHGRLIFGDATE